jgi:hypothetical protein
MNVKIVLHLSQIPINYVMCGRELLRKLDLAKPITFTYWLSKADNNEPNNRLRSGHRKYCITFLGYPFLQLNHSDNTVYSLCQLYKAYIFSTQCIMLHIILIVNIVNSKILSSVNRRTCGVFSIRKGLIFLVLLRWYSYLTSLKEVLFIWTAKLSVLIDWYINWPSYLRK